MKRYIDVDKLIAELTQTYAGSMADIVIMPLGIENWLNARARHISENPANFRPSKEDIEAWDKQLEELHAKGDLDSTIKELAVICAHSEEYHMDHLQTECYQRALAQLNYLRWLLTV